jgi:hypothetical protein
VARQIRAAVQRVPDWDLVLGLAERHRVVPLLTSGLAGHAADLVDERVFTELQTRYRDSARHNLLLAAELLRLMDCFAERGIDAVPFKGPVAAVRIYGDLALRSCGDIDLLVDPAVHGATERLLLAEGYEVTQRYPAAMQSSLWHAQRGLSVDLHWGMPPDTLMLHTDRLRERLEPVTLLGRRVLTFSPRDTLLIAAVNATKEYWVPSLHHLSDIVALTCDYSAGDWETILHRARSIGCRRMLLAALLLAHRLLGAPLPVASTGRFERAATDRVADEIQAHLFLSIGEDVTERDMQLAHHTGQQSYYLALTDSAWRRGSGWFRWAVTPNRADQEYFHLPGRLRFLHYILRPLRLIMRRLNGRTALGNATDKRGAGNASGDRLPE